ncbi:MAG: hypothetical protein L0Y44_04090 [Phycisphaerales bacterium]|nr:hypothetical protein [Phycisphaerales bacterium]MCI0674699.1 hypothetical protein [Phycisphaerales bacterium]
MAPSELIRTVTEVLNDLEIPYFITGSVASIVFGEGRQTADVDIVAQVEDRHVVRLCAAFPADRLYISEDAVREAIGLHGQFNIIDSTTGYKADIIVPAPTALNAQRFARARRVRPAAADRTYWFASPEDVIVKKLEAHREGGSDKHLRDVAGIIKTMGDQLDREYIERWAATLSIDDIWRAVVKRTNG